MKKILLLAAIALASCSTESVEPDLGDFKYEVTSSRTWSGSYIDENGTEVYIWNQPTTWEYNGTVKEKPFLMYVRMTQDSPYTVPTYIRCKIIYNGTILRDDVDTFTNITSGMVTIFNLN